MEKHNRDSRWIMGQYENINEYDFNTDKSTALEKLVKKLKIEIVKEEDRELEFDIIGCDVALVNAFRRILLSEVPTMAIEKVYMLTNSSLLQDEVLSHRLGLIPLRADPRLFEYPSSKGKDKVSDHDTLRYELKVSCTVNPQAPKFSRLPEDMYKNSKVYSKDIKWTPIGQQAEMFSHGAEQFGVIENDILICKMRPGHQIHAFMEAVKGIGRDHAKFSPVATASYRMMPAIRLTKPVRNDNAFQLQKCFSPGVIEVVEETSSGQKYHEARVKNARYDTCSRNVYQYEQLKDCVELSRIKDHFIFTIESVGALPSAELFVEAVKVLKNKCRTFLSELEKEKL